ncbi:MAG: hypothetical protein PHI78_01930 [Clostridia bacterium]|nr:hypothetical protein [Clostridia bacterium]
MEKKSVYMICVSIIIGFVILGLFLFFGLSVSTRYEVVSHGDTLIVFDQVTGDYWQKYVPQFSGPTEWYKYSFPTE